MERLFKRARIHAKDPKSSSIEVIDLCSEVEGDITKCSDRTLTQDSNDAVQEAFSKIEAYCAICSKDFSEYSLQQQEKHLNLCIKEQNNNVERIRRHTYCCKICDKALYVSESILVSDTHIIERLQHIKACAIEHGISGPEDLKLFQKYDKPYLKTKHEDVFDIFKPKLVLPPAITPIVLATQETGYLDELKEELEARNVTTHLMEHARKQNAKDNANENKQSTHDNGKGVKLKPNPPLYKKIIGSEFVVDGFKYYTKKYYFLTHFHADHYVGLSRKSLGKKIIVCTGATSRLVQLKLNIAIEQIIEVEYYQVLKFAQHIITCLPANHCPGAALFFFRNSKTNTGTLHTGDFRYDQKQIGVEKLHLNMIRSNGPRNGLFPIENVYLDTTYCSKTSKFIPQQLALDKAIKLVSRYGKQNTCLVLFGTYTIGKEKVIVSVVNALAEDGECVNIGCSASKFKVLKCLDLNNLFPNFYSRFQFTIDKQTTRFHIGRMQDINPESLVSYLKTFNKLQNKQYRRIIGVKPTGWTREVSVKHDLSQTATVINIPYSEHSSIDELRRFVLDINIRQRNKAKIIPTVTTSKANLKLLFHRT